MRVKNYYIHSPFVVARVSRCVTADVNMALWNVGGGKFLAKITKTCFGVDILTFRRLMSTIVDVPHR